jgi:hypothetical protein
MQNWLRLQHYPADYLNLVYRYYAAHGVSYICNYYHLDLPSSTADLEVLDSGAYEVLGELSGYCWEKITLLPIYNTEQIQPVFEADERGFGKFNQSSSLNFPTLYNIQPTATDFIQFVEPKLNESDAPSIDSPLYRVVNFEKATNSFFSFWKLSLQVSEFTLTKLEKQLRAIFSFVDYEKQIYDIDTATLIYRLLDKNQTSKVKDYYNERIGFYFNS